MHGFDYAQDDATSGHKIWTWAFCPWDNRGDKGAKGNRGSQHHDGMRSEKVGYENEMLI